MAKPSAMKARRVPAARTATTITTATAATTSSEAHPRVTRAAAAPAPARKTQFRSDRPTPVRPVQQAADNRRVLKKTGRMGSRRGGQRDEEEQEEEGQDEEEEEEGEGEEGETVTLRGGAVEEAGRLSLPLVSEANNDDDDDKAIEGEVPESSPPYVSRYEPPLNLLPNDDSVSLTSISEDCFSTVEPDLSNTQIDIEELDVDLMLEMFPHLDAHGRKILDLLILKPPTRDLRRLLLVPGSMASKRLRTYEQNFAASKMAYGTSEYISVRQVEVALGGDESFRPLLYISNLSILADVAYTSQGSGNSTFEKLKQIERDFPAQFGDVVRSTNFQAALDLRTQYLVLALANQQDMDGFDPNIWLKQAFFDGDSQIKPWPGVEDVDNWMTRVIQRIEEIRGTFAKDSRDGPVDISTLVDMFPWDDFVNRISSYVKTRFSEVEKLRSYRSVEDLVEKVRKPQMLEDARVIDLLDDREIPETVQEEPTPVKPHARLSQQLPGVEPEKVAAPVAVCEPPTAEKDEGLLAMSSDLSKLKERIEQQGLGALDSASVHLTTAQMKDLKRRKTMPAPETVPVAKGTPRVATSLGSKDATAMTMDQVKFLKQIIRNWDAPKQTEPSKEPSASKQPVASTQVEDSVLAKAPRQVEDSASVEAPRQVEVSGPMEDDVGEDNDPKTSARAEMWKDKLKDMGKMGNKENDKSLAATIPPLQPGRPLKRKRFIDPQIGATRISQIDDGARQLPAKRQQLQKGKEKEVVIIEEAEESRPAFETEDQDEAEDAEMYEVDSRKEDEERLKKSRKGLPDIGPSNAARTSTSSATALAAPRVSTSSTKTGEQNASKPRKIVPTKASRSSKGSRASGGTDASRKLSAAGVSDVIEFDTDDTEYAEEEEEGEEGEDEEGEEEEGADEIEDEDDSADNNARRAELNRRVQKIVEKNPPKKVKPKQLLRTRQPWGRKQTALLVRIIGEIGCRWAEIRDMNFPEFSGRSNVQLKDKARNIKYDYLRARQQLPPNFEDVTISRTQVQTLHQMGINCDDYI